MKFKISLFILPALAALSGCAELDQLRERTAVQELEIQRLREELGAAKKNSDKLAELRTSEGNALRAQINELTADLNHARRDRTNKERSLEEEREKLKLDLDATIQERNAKIEQANALINQQTAAAAKAAEERKALMAQLDALNGQISEGAQKSKKTEAELDAMKKTRADLESKLKDSEATTKSLADAQAEAKRLKADLEKRKAADPENDAKLQEAAKKLKEKLGGPAGGGTEVRLDSRGLRMIIPSDFAFDKGTVLLSAGAKAVLGEAAAAIASLPGRAVRVEGHTDNEPIIDLPFADNFGLGAARADCVRNYLMNDKGIEAKRLSVASRGSQDPLADNKTAENKARNRRVEIVIGAGKN